MKKLILAVVAAAFFASPAQAGPVVTAIGSIAAGIQSFAAASAFNAFVVRLGSGLILNALGAALRRRNQV